MTDLHYSNCPLPEPCSVPNDTVTKVVNLERRFTDHINTYERDKIDIAHTHALHEDAYLNNMKAIAELTEATKGLVDAWTLANNFQRFVRWLSSFAILGGIITWVIAKLPHPWP